MKGIILFAALLAFSSVASKGEESYDNFLKLSANMEESNKNRTVLEGWLKFEKAIKDIANAGIKVVLPLLMDNTGKLNISKECMKNNMHVISGIRNIRPWALRFFDSSAKIMDGILTGSLSAFGDYDECLDTEVRSTKLRDKGKLLFRGQYCTIDVVPPLPPKTSYYKMDDILEELKNFSLRDTAIGESSKYAHFFHFLTLRFGVCTPSGCSIEDMNKIANLVGNALSLNATASRCELKEENQFTPLVITVMICYSFAGFLMLVGSLIDIYAYYRKIIFKNKFIRVLLAFSLFTNFRKFANTETSTDTLSCLNGVRFLSMTWVILGHTYLSLNFQMFLGLEKGRDSANTFAFQAITNATVVVDTFFFVGGLLVCYLTIKLVRIQGRKFSSGLYIFHRLWRIYPVYIYVLMFMYLTDLLGSGPIWHDTTFKYRNPCYYNWWTNLIFINNFYDAEHMCLPQSWYIATDFQLYIVALFILLPMIRWPKVGIFLSILVIMASVCYCGISTYVNDYPPTMLFVHPDPEQRSYFWANFYFKPFVHAGPYYVGILAGYLLATKPDLKIPPLMQLLGWCLAFSFNLSVLYGVLGWNRGADPTFWSTILYASCNRLAWSLGIAWMIVCCATGHGGIINYILSWKAFVPLGRLTYVAYLIHPIVQITIIGNVRTQIQADHFFIVWLFFGHLCVTYGIAFAGSMLIESPFLALENVFLPRGEKKSEHNFFVKGNDILRESQMSKKNGDIAAIIPSPDEESGGIDNKCIVYKL